jgi:hypothetical protein
MEQIAKFFIPVFGLIGLGLLAGAFLALKTELDFRREAVVVPGTVVELETTSGSKGSTLYKPVFEFTDRQGQPHRVTAGIASNPPSHDRGEAVTVRYRSENPEDAHLDGFMASWFLPTILGAMGSLFTAVAAGFLIHIVRKRRIRAWLADNGMRVQAKLTGVELDTTIRVNGRHPWRLSAQWQHPVTGKVHVFHSDSIWFDPTDFVQRESLDVKVNADDPSQYHVDIGFLPKGG